jgi:hypothetical protein
MYYGRTNLIPKIKKQEFLTMDELKGFKFGLPAIVLDFVDTMTGSEFITELIGLLR